MDKHQLRETLQSFGRALADNNLPLTFFMGGDVEFGRVDVMNSTEPGKYLKSVLEDLTAKAFGVDKELIDELMITFYLMMNTSVLIEHTAHSVRSGQYQASIDREVLTLDEDEIKEMYRLHGQEIPEKAWKDLNKAIDGIQANYSVSKIKALRIDWGRCKTTNPRKLTDYDDGIHIIPVDVMVGYLDKLKELARTKILKIKYRRTNNADRIQYVTLSTEATNLVYKEDLRFANTFHEMSTPKPFLYHGVYTHFETIEGFWKVPDLGLSRFIGNPTRRVSLSRIIELKFAGQDDLNEIMKYVNVDIDNVLDMFIFYATQLTPEQTDKVMRDLSATTDLIQFVQSQVTIFSTMYLKSLHDYMVTNQELFNGYTGIKTSAYEDALHLRNTDIKFGNTTEIDF